MFKYTYCTCGPSNYRFYNSECYKIVLLKRIAIGGGRRGRIEQFENPCTKSDTVFMVAAVNKNTIAVYVSGRYLLAEQMNNLVLAG